MKMFNTIVLALVLPLHSTTFCVAQGTQQGEQVKRENDVIAPDSRSYMELFAKLEDNWMKAAKEKDKNALETIMAPEFVLRTAENPETLISRADWIEQAGARYDGHSFSQRAMVIRAFLGVAVVSFVQEERVSENAKNRSRDYFIVDVWKASHEKWQVCARYVGGMSNLK
jgi:hypothetical protein